VSSTDGNRRPRPLASTSAPAVESRTAKKVSKSTELGGNAHDPNRKQHHHPDDRDKLGWTAEELPYEIVELPNESSMLGISQPMLVPYEPEVVDAKDRGTIAKRLLSLLGLILILLTIAIVIATFVGVPADLLITYAKWVASALIPLFTMALGYYFGAAQQHRSRRN
jgi:hypothetical protein